MKEESIIESWRTKLVLGTVGIFSLIFLASLIGLLWFPLFLFFNSIGALASGFYLLENRRKWKKSYCVLTISYIVFYYSDTLYKRFNWLDVIEIEIIPDFWVTIRHGSIHYGYMLVFNSDKGKDQVKLYCFPFRKSNQLLIIKKILEITKALKIKINLEDTGALYKLDARIKSSLTARTNSNLAYLDWKCKNFSQFQLKISSNKN